jgi:cleavage and polyadenylation specificity factor subunit 5
LKPGEDDNQGLKRILNGLLGKEEESKLEQDQWEIGELVAVWWRPNFEVMEVFTY